MRLLDLYCGAGGAAMGYSKAGFDVVGVDSVYQHRFPFEFVCCDAIEYVLECGDEYDVIHASPPCQVHSRAYSIMGGDHVDHIGVTRDALVEVGKPFIIENVVGAPLLDPIMLCGNMFGLRTYRHRLFEISQYCIVPPIHGEHIARSTKMGRRLIDGEFMVICGHITGVDDAREIMGIDWMIRREIVQAIPPIYTEYIGKEIIKLSGASL